MECRSLKDVQRVQVGPLVQQQVHAIHVSVGRSDHQRRAVQLVDAVGRPRLVGVQQQFAQDVHVTGGCCNIQVVAVKSSV